MTTLTCMRGYPGTGKSTRAREIASQTGAVVVCRDDLRKMLHGVHFSGKGDLEHEVTIAEHAQVEAFLKAGKSVIVDATHLRPAYLRDWAKLSVKLGVDFAVEDVRTDPLVCTDLDRKRGDNGERYVGASVIAGMVKRYPMDKWPEIVPRPKPTTELVPYDNDELLTPAIIVDIDGTLAHMTDHGHGERSPFDYSRVHEDTVDETVRELVNREAKDGTLILVCSGRDSNCYRQTRRWLVDNGITFDALLMRPDDAKDDFGQKLPDWIVKANIFDEYIRGKFHIKYVLDDRQQVVDMWRALGLKCLQVEPGQF